MQDRGRSPTRGSQRGGSQAREAWSSSSAPTLQLFCFPYAGASCSLYVRWKRLCAPWIEVVPVELPGRGRLRGEPLRTSVAALVEAVARRISPDAGRPFALFGHSLGALVAFEYARYLHAERHAEPVLLLASGSPAPSTAARRPAPQTDAELIRELRRLDGTPSAILSSAELMELALPSLRADFQAAASYRSPVGAPINCPIHAIGGTRDEFGEEALSAWRDHTNGDFFLNLLPGGHFFIHESELELIALIERSLRRQLCAAGRASGKEDAALRAGTHASGSGFP